MEAARQRVVLQMLLDRLCQASDPATIYKTLKELSRVPLLRDSLAEIGFRQTIECLKKQQLLVRFAKDLAAKWSTGSPLGPQPEQAPQDFGLATSLMTEPQRTSLEERPQEPASQEGRRGGREDFTGDSSCRPGATSRLSLSRESHISWEARAPRSGSPDPGESRSPKQTRVGQSQVQPCKRKRESPWQADAQRPPAKVPRGKSQSSKELRPTAARAIAESRSSAQACFAGLVPEESSSHGDPEASPCAWSHRKDSKTPVYSGRRLAAGQPQKGHRGLLAEKPAGPRDAARCHQDAKEEAEARQPEEESRAEKHTWEQSRSETETPTHLQLPESQEVRLRALVARLQSTGEARQQSRRTIMVSYLTQPSSPGLRAGPGPRGQASALKSPSLPEAPAHRQAQRDSCQPAGGRVTKKTTAKRPAPLMAKALRDYRKRYSGK